ncbi:sensor histidine kinase [Streptomyces sp. NPDC053560]|uniref:sensor histidine kinase n=1 Tax=Streptomyces sp. NPDC053560 TaxID=3365711 RepID=UPI0037CFE1FF
MTSVQHWVERFGGANGPARYRRYALGSITSFAVFEAALWVFWLVGSRADGPSLAVVAVLAAAHVWLQAVLCRVGMRHYLGLVRRPYPLVGLYTGVTVVTVAVGCWLEVSGRIDGGDLAPYVLWLLMFYSGPPLLALGLRGGVLLVATVAAATLIAVAAIGVRGESLALAVGASAFTVPFTALAYRVTGWSVHLVDELAAARVTQARLAVAEERLRFGRDLHDVLGRNLAVVALKSELAVQLARRGKPEAVDQMVEVQRIAQDSQREIRSVVRGYRMVDLHTELVGARSVLDAAGIPCRIEDGPAARLPAEIQSALGWVVREATTNVLRHAQGATRCEVSLRESADGTMVLVIENDGTDEGDAAGQGGGSGLAGLRERLVELNGTLTTQTRSGGVFRLTVTVPVTAPWEEEA